jgi:flagellar biosynthesis protein FlhG
MSDHPASTDWAAFDLAPGASLEDLQRAYRRRRSLYGPTSLATYSLFAEEERQLVLDALDGAYRRLLASFPATPHQEGEPRADAVPPSGDVAATPAAYLRRLRELRGMSLHDVSQRTKIRPPVLEALETEDVAVLPAAVYVRGFVIQVARLLGAPEPEGLAQRYLARLAARESTSE